MLSSVCSAIVDYSKYKIPVHFEGAINKTIHETHCPILDKTDLEKLIEPLGKLPKREEQPRPAYAYHPYESPYASAAYPSMNAQYHHHPGMHHHPHPGMQHIHPGYMRPMAPVAHSYVVRPHYPAMNKEFMMPPPVPGQTHPHPPVNSATVQPPLTPPRSVGVRSYPQTPNQVIDAAKGKEEEKIVRPDPAPTPPLIE